MSKNDGGSAFPQSGYQQWAPMPGMTLRDYFAAKAMQGLCVEAGKSTIVDVMSHIELCAKISFRIADEMLAAREASK